MHNQDFEKLRQEFTQFWQHWARIVILWFCLWGLREEAEDLAQEMGLRLWHWFCKEGKFPENPEAFLRRMARNLHIDFGKKRAREARAALVLREMRVEADPSSGPDSQVMCEDLWQKIQESLEPRERKALALRADGFTHEEIAEALRCCRRTTLRILASAQEKLQEVPGIEW